VELVKASPSLALKYECKHAHLQTKNFVRAAYLQRAKELIDDKLHYLEHDARVEAGTSTEETRKFEAIRLKCICKLYEALGHLLCDPYIFERGEEAFKKAEDIYTANLELIGAD
jgi:hypothetical protein